mmetsp:Transcript_29610/g.45131  ORF Transcript_29610/g.45131 Transcript_29610/m.45131 type:complete len:172 (+) Transcript_29610:781-1296(+)
MCQLINVVLFEAKVPIIGRILLLLFVFVMSPPLFILAWGMIPVVVVFSEVEIIRERPYMGFPHPKTMLMSILLFPFMLLYFTLISLLAFTLGVIVASLMLIPFMVTEVILIFVIALRWSGRRSALEVAQKKIELQLAADKQGDNPYVEAERATGVTAMGPGKELQEPMLAT